MDTSVEDANSLFGDYPQVQKGTSIEDANALFGDSMPLVQPVKDQGQEGLPEQHQQGFWGRVGNDLSQRANAMGQTVNPLHGVGQTAGMVNDIAQEGMTSAWQSIPEENRQNIKGNLENIAQNPIINRFAVQPAKSGMENIGAWEKEYPEATKYVQDVGNIVGAVPLIKGFVGPAGFIKDMGADLLNPATKAAEVGNQSAAALKRGASGLYDESSAQNIVFEPQQQDKLAKDLSSLKPTDSLKRRNWEKTSAPDEIKTITDSMEEGPITFNGALDSRTRLNSMINKAFLAKDDVEARHLQGVRDAINDAMLSSDNPKWEEANHEWGKGATQQPLEEMATRASTKAQPTTSLDTYINNFLQSRKSAGLLPNERALLQDVVKNSSTDQLKQTVGSRLIKYPAAMLMAKFGAPGKIAGFLMGHYGAGFARDSAFAQKIAKLDKVYEAIQNRSFKGVIANEAVAENPLLLTDQRASTAAQKAAKAAAGSNTGNVIHGAAPLTSDAERFATPPPNYEAPRPVETKMLPSPTMINPSERQVTPWGSAHPAPYSNQSLRQGAAEVGLTPDVARAQKSAQETNLMQRFAQQKAAEKAAQEAAVWSAKGPEDIKALIDRGMANQQDLSEALGEGFNRNDMTEALLRARQGKSTGGIIKRFKKKPK